MKGVSRTKLSFEIYILRECFASLSKTSVSIWDTSSNRKHSVVQTIRVKAEAGFDPVSVLCLSDASGQRTECGSPLICVFSNTPRSLPTPLALGQCPPASMERKTQTTRALTCQAARLFVNNWLRYFTPHHTHEQQTEGRQRDTCNTQRVHVCWHTCDQCSLCSSKHIHFRSDLCGGFMTISSGLVLLAGGPL